MKIADIRGLTPDQLADTLISLKKEHASTCASSAATGPAREYDPPASSAIRKDIARIKTVLPRQGRGVKSK
jgi:large subunit ribosomal protein L29